MIYLVLSETFKIFETKEANHEMLWLAFFAFHQDTIKVSLPGAIKSGVGIAPTHHQPYIPIFNVRNFNACVTILKAKKTKRGARQQVGSRFHSGLPEGRCPQHPVPPLPPPLYTTREMIARLRVIGHAMQDKRNTVRSPIMSVDEQPLKVDGHGQ